MLVMIISITKSDIYVPPITPTLDITEHHCAPERNYNKDSEDRERIVILC